MQRRTFWLTGLCLVTAIVGFQKGWFRRPADPADEMPAPVSMAIETARPTAAEDVPRPELPVGRRYPYLKTVVQELSQSGSPAPYVSQTVLELQFGLMVEEVAPERTRLSVRYDRVRYRREMSGDRLEYDSATAAHPVPVEALPYHGLAGNGFSFWLDGENRIVEFVGFDAFLDRCVRVIPAEHRQAVLATLAARGRDDAVATFLDESIGLLPFGAAEPAVPTKAGDAWSQERKLAEPVPLNLSTRYTIRSADEATLEVDILGNIVPAPSYAPSYAQVSYTPSDDVNLRVRNGHTFGSCRIGRRTGLPLEARLERWLTMAVTLPDGTTLDQRKKVISTLQAQPLEEPSTN